jgi:small subunit ribosomal protein S18|tara:strand:+ start:347 stop:616 length:270 start_codon:yes stop_codon:yes gene_type:complete
MKRKKNIKNKKKFNQSKLSLFQKSDIKFSKSCPLSGKNAPDIDYKNIKILKKYISESGRILPSRVTSVSFKKQRELAKSIKRARLLALI